MKQFKGTEKQVKWAQDIVNSCIDLLDQRIAKASEKDDPKWRKLYRYDIYTEIKKMLLEYVDHFEYASQIIDQRRKLSCETIERIAWEMENKKRG